MSFIHRLMKGTRERNGKKRNSVPVAWRELRERNTRPLSIEGAVPFSVTSAKFCTHAQRNRVK